MRQRHFSTTTIVVLLAAIAVGGTALFYFGGDPVTAFKSTLSPWDAIGWMGTGSYLAAYALLSAGKVQGHSYPYQMLNLVGGVAVTANALSHHVVAVAVGNVIWVVIAAATMARRSIARRPGTSRLAGSGSIAGPALVPRPAARQR